MTKEVEAVGIPQQFRKRPIVVEAVQFTEASKDRCFNWVMCNHYADFDGDKPAMVIQTLEGGMRASIGDWIIKGVKGEFYPCKPDIFAATYEPVDAAPEAEAERGTWFVVTVIDESGKIVPGNIASYGVANAIFQELDDDTKQIIPVVTQAAFDAERERADELQRQLAEAKRLIGDAPNIKTTLPPEFQRLWEACNTLVENSQFKVVFRHIEEVEKQLEAATARAEQAEAELRDMHADDELYARHSSFLERDRDQWKERAEQAEAEAAFVQEEIGFKLIALRGAIEDGLQRWRAGEISEACWHRWDGEVKALESLQEKLNVNASAAILSELRELRSILREAVSTYGKPGGPWNVPTDPGGWLARAREALGELSPKAEGKVE